MSNTTDDKQQHLEAPPDDGAAKGARKRAKKTTASTLASALRDAQEQIKNVPKNGHNKFHGYDYTTAEDMIAACKYAFVSNGLVGRRTGWALHFEPGVTMGLTKTGGAVVAACCLVTSRFDIEHVDSGETRTECVTYPAIPEKGRPLDKAVSGALSTSLSYWWRDTLQVPRCDYEVDVGQTGQFDDPTPAASASSSAATEPPPRQSHGGQTGSRTPNGDQRALAHYTAKLRAAVSHGVEAVKSVGDEIRNDRAVPSGSEISRSLFDEYKRCSEDAKRLPPPATEREAIERGGW